jgi:general secretion pathway protein A
MQSNHIRTYRGPFSAEALSRLGFREHPFLPSADPRFLYLSKQHLAVLDRVQDVINWREGLSVVEGLIGVGKTSIARRLHQIFEFEPGYKTVFIHTATYSTPTQAVRDIGYAFGRKTKRAYVDQLRDFEHYLIALKEREENAVLIIDDAQRMSTTSLDTIQDFMNFDVREKMIQIILFAQPEIHGTFAENQAVLSRVASWQKLSPLPVDDANSLIQFRCQVAGRERPLYTDSAMLRIYEETEGVPRPMILISAEILRILIENDKSVADVPEVENALSVYQQRFEELEQ